MIGAAQLDAGHPPASIGQQSGDMYAAADVDGRFRDGGHRVLEQLASRGQGGEPLVARPRGAIGDAGRHGGQPVVARGTRGGQQGRHLGQLLVEQLPAPRHEEVHQAELHDSRACPAAGRLLRRLRRRFRVAFQDGDVVPLLRYQQRRGQANEAAAHDNDAWHFKWTPSCECPDGAHFRTSGE